MLDLPDFKPGQRLTADALNQILGEIARLAKLNVVPPVYLKENGSAGLVLSISLPMEWWIKLTAAGTGGAYAWTRMIPDPNTPGGWLNSPGGESGTTTTNPAYEAGGNASIPLSPNPIVLAWWDKVSGDLRFQNGGC